MVDPLDLINEAQEWKDLTEEIEFGEFKKALHESLCKAYAEATPPLILLRELVYCISELLPNVDMALPSVHSNSFTLLAERWHGRTEEALGAVLAAYSLLKPEKAPEDE